MLYYSIVDPYFRLIFLHLFVLPDGRFLEGHVFSQEWSLDNGSSPISKGGHFRKMQSECDRCRGIF